MDTRNYTLASFPIWLVRDGYWRFRCHYRSFINYFFVAQIFIYSSCCIVNYVKVFLL